MAVVPIAHVTAVATLQRPSIGPLWGVLALMYVSLAALTRCVTVNELQQPDVASAGGDRAGLGSGPPDRDNQGKVV